MMTNSFSENLKRLRKDAGLSQSSLAQEIGMTQRSISYLESGKIEPDLNTLIKISKFFEFTVDYLLGLEN